MAPLMKDQETEGERDNSRLIILVSKLMGPKYLAPRLLIGSGLLVAAYLVFAQVGKIEILTPRNIAQFLFISGLVVIGLPTFGKSIFRSLGILARSDFLEVDRRAARERGVSARVEGGDLHIHQSFDVQEEIERAVAESLRSTDHKGTFTGHFMAISQLLESKADVADQKASILLNRGIAYSWGGVLFYLVTIIAWQWLARDGGMQPRIIAGIISCSLLFIFVEFLSAWFLRQYRHFVDTSTYLIKVKAIFDRYMLAYTLANEAGEHVDKKFGALNNMLGGTLQWPETKIFAFGDTSFAKEAAEAFPGVVKAMKNE